jgi:hypothetical protein
MGNSNPDMHAQIKGLSEVDRVTRVLPCGRWLDQKILLPWLFGVLGIIVYGFTEYSTWKYGRSAIQAKKSIDQLLSTPKLAEQQETLAFWTRWRFVGALTSFSVFVGCLLCTLVWRTTLVVCSLVLTSILMLLSVMSWSIMF